MINISRIFVIVTDYDSTFCVDQSGVFTYVNHSNQVPVHTLYEKNINFYAS